LTLSQHQPSPLLSASAALFFLFLPHPGEIPEPGIKPRSPALQADSLPAPSINPNYLSKGSFSNSVTLRVRAVR